MRKRLAATLLVLACFISYWPAIGGGLLWDDDRHVSENRALRSGAGLWQIWTQPRTTPQYYPLTHTTFWIEYQLVGDRHTWLYHADNIALHALSALLVWRLLAMLAIDRRAALLAAALFALHPVQVESVAWISERKNVLSLTFELAALIALFRSERDARNISRPTGTWPFVAPLLFFTLAMLSKTVACSMPAVALLLMAWRNGRVTRRNVARLVPFFAIGLAGALLTADAEKHHVGASGADWSFSAIERILIAGRALWFYAAKLIWPTTLTFSYPRWRIDAHGVAPFAFPLSAIAAVTALYMMRRRFGRGPAIATLLFAGVLVPALGFVNVYPMRYSFVADHFQYAAMIALIVPIAIVITRHARPIALILLPTLCVLTWRRAGDFSDVETLWRDTIAKNPASWMARQNLAVTISDRADIDEANGKTSDARARREEALSLFDSVERLRPQHELVAITRGLTLMRLARWQAAIDTFQIGRSRLSTSNDDVKRSASVYDDIGRCLANLSRDEEAANAFREAIALDPQARNGYADLATTRRRQHRERESLDAYDALLRVRPDDGEALRESAALLADRGSDDAAIVRYRQYLIRATSDYEAWTALGISLCRLQHYEDGVRAFNEALTLKPEFLLAKRGLAAATAMSTRAAHSVATRPADPSETRETR